MHQKSLARVTSIAVAALATAAMTLAFASGAGAVTITEIAANPTAVASQPQSIAAGSEGSIWWTEEGSAPSIGHISTGGERFPQIAEPLIPLGIVVAPSGWVSWGTKSGTAARTPKGVVEHRSYVSKFPVPVALGVTGRVAFAYGGPADSYVCVAHGDNLFAEESDICDGTETNSAVTGLAVDPTGLVWVSLGGADRVAVFNSKPELTESLGLPQGSDPAGIAIGPEGSAWVTMAGADAVDRVEVDLDRTRFPLPSGSRPEDIALGPDGAFWVTASGTDSILRMTTAGTLTGEYPTPTRGSEPTSIAAGTDGALWFTEAGAGNIGRLVPDGPPSAPVDPAPGGGSPSGGGNPPPIDRTAPAFLGSPAFSPARFAVAGGRKARAGKGTPRGSKLKFSLSENATVTVVIARSAPGRRAGRACVAPGKAKPGAAKCARSLPQGTLTLSGHAGPNLVPFTGKVAGKALAPGSYKATLGARDAAGNLSASKTAAFTISP
jgi:streptogramin lyase